jgi:hypothetical protein
VNDCASEASLCHAFASHICAPINSQSGNVGTFAIDQDGSLTDFGQAGDFPKSVGFNGINQIKILRGADVCLYLAPADSVWGRWRCADS